MNRWDKYFARGGTFLPLNEIFLGLLLKEVERRSGQYPRSVIDFGCGDGDALIKFARRGFKAIGIDSSQVVLEKARTNIAMAGFDDVLLGEQDLDNLVLDTSVDLAFSKLTFAFLKNTDAFLECITRHLNPHGAFVLITPVTYPNFEYSSADKPDIAVDFDATYSRLRQYFGAVDPWHHNYFAGRGDTATFIATK